MTNEYNDGERRQRNVRLAVRNVPTPRNPSEPSRGDVAISSRQRTTNAGRSARQRSRAGKSSLPIRRLRIALCSVMACLIFVFLGSCISHGSAGLEPSVESKLLNAPVEPGYTFAFSTPRSQWKAGTMPHIYQIDPAWSELPYAGGTIRQNGCGPTCLTMVYIFKTGNTDKTPVDICALAEIWQLCPHRSHRVVLYDKRSGTAPPCGNSALQHTQLAHTGTAFGRTRHRVRATGYLHQRRTLHRTLRH